MSAYRWNEGLCRVRSLLSAQVGGRLPILTSEELDRAKQFTIAINERQGVQRSSRAAAVLVPLCCVDGRPSIIFTLRSVRVGTHKSQISFPGGYVEQIDNDARDTALREMQEELRGSYDYTSGIQILGETGQVPAINGAMVSPVIGALTIEFMNDFEIAKSFHNPNEEEVELVFARSIDDLVQSETNEPLARLGTIGPCYPGTQGKIWGLTAIILRPLLKEILIPAFF